MTSYDPCGDCSSNPKLQPCPLDLGHAGGHLYWLQTAKPGQQRGHNAVWVYDADGEAVMHCDFSGYVDPEQVGALIAWVNERDRDRKAVAQ